MNCQTTVRVNFPLVYSVNKYDSKSIILGCNSIFDTYSVFFERRYVKTWRNITNHCLMCFRFPNKITTPYKGHNKPKEIKRVRNKNSSILGVFCRGYIHKVNVAGVGVGLLPPPAPPLGAREVMNKLAKHNFTMRVIGSLFNTTEVIFC